MQLMESILLIEEVRLRSARCSSGFGYADLKRGTSGRALAAR